MKKFGFYSLFVLALLLLIGCNPKEITISFETNSGIQLDSVKVLQNSSLSDLPEASRIGYDFLGWFYNSELDQPLDETTPVLRNITLYAKWEIQTYTITFMSDEEVYLTSFLVYGNEITMPVDPVKTGYHFLGWYFEESLFEDDTIVTSDFVLTAEFEIDEYDITFNLGNGTIEVITITYGEEIQTFPSSVLAPMDGKMIVWKTYEDEVLGDVADFDDITSDMSVISVYVDVYLTITIDDLQGNITTEIIKYGEIISRPLTDPSKEHYSFSGWVGEDELQYDFSSAVTEEFTISASYTILKFQVSFYNENGQMIGGPQTINYGLDAIAPAYTAPLGYVFSGWDKGFSTITQNTQVNVVLVGNDYEITFETFGGSTVSSINQTIGEVVSSPENPTKTGYTFGGWYLDEAYLNEYASFTTMPYNGLALFAKWTPNNYTITLDPQLGSVSQTTVPVLYNASIGYLPTPVRPGYQFLGWSLNPNETASNYITSSSNYTQTQNITIYAIWDYADYVMNLFVNGGDALISNTASVTYMSPISTFILPTRLGYTFEGWNTLSSGLGTTYENSDIYQLTSNLNLYAIWEASEVSLAYTVEYYFENVDDDLYTLGEQVSYPGVTDTEVEAIINSYSGFTYAVDSPFNVISGTILGDGSLVLKVYYDRIIFTVTLIDSSDTSSGFFMVKYDGFLTNLETPVRTGFTFLGWVDSEGNEYTAQNQIAENLILYARWNQLICTVTIERIFLKGDIEQSRSTITTQVGYGNDFSPVSLIEGYDFNYFIGSDLVEHVLAADTLNITDNETIQVYFDMQSFTINFTQFLSTAEDITMESFTVYYDETFSNLPTLILSGNASYSLVIWNRTVFQNVKSNIDVFAVYYPASGKTVTFTDNGTIKYIISDTDVPTGQIITENSPIWNLQKSGYVFLGWYYDLLGQNPVSITDLDFTLLGSSVNLYALWEQLFPYDDPTDVTVSVSGTSVSVTWHQTTLLGMYPSSFNLLIDGVEYVLTSSNYTRVATSFTYTNVLLDKLKDVGTHHVAVKALGDNLGSLNSAYSVVCEHVVATEEEEISDVEIYDYFIIETTISGNENYIFYTDMTYNFSSKYSFLVLDGNEVISSNQNLLITSGTPGLFEIMMFKTVDNVTTQTLIQGKVVTYINQFQLGKSLTDFNNETTSDNYLNPNFEMYKVGNKNDFYFTLSILNNTGSKVDMNDTVLDFAFYLKTGSTYSLLEGEDLASYVTQKTGYLFKFTTLATGRQFKVEIAPRYQSLEMTVPTRTFEFVVEDAYNAFTNAQLQVLFKNLSVHHIILHSDITALVDPLYLNEDGSPMNGYSQVLPSGTIDYRGNVYQRVGVSNNDSLVLDGNYFTIDGSGLPYVKVTSDPDGGYTDVGVGTGSTYGIVSVQIGIFCYNVTPDPTKVLINNDNAVYYSNLTILGNTTTPSVNYSLSAEEILYQEQLMSINSGGLAGVMTRNGSTYLENVNIGYTTIACFLTAYGYKLDGVTSISTNTNYVRIYDSWANSFYDYGSPMIDIKNSDIGSSGGAAIHLEDVRPGNSGIENITVTIDDSTVINNWISGDEAWFKAFGFSGLALLLKSQAEVELNKMDKSIIHLEENQITGALSEKINFIILSRDMDSAVTEDEFFNQTSGSEIVLHLEDETGVNTLARAFNFLQTDFRSTQVTPGTLLSPVGIYSSSAAFYAAFNTVCQDLSYLAGYGYTAQDIAELAINVVYIASFYNLSLPQAENVVGAIGEYGLTVSQAVAAVVGESMPAQPKYLEIAQEAAGLGKVQLILEYGAQAPL